MQQSQPEALYTPEQRARRDATKWTLVQGVLAPVQFLVFLVSLYWVLNSLKTGEHTDWALASVVIKTLVLYAIMITGSIWGRPTWGTWWVWDGRLTSMLVLFFLYLGYIALSNASSEKGDTSRVAAVFGVIGAVNIPIINRSVIWWESQHQKASITLSGSSIDTAYLVPLFVAVAGFSLLFGALVLMRMRAALAEMRIEARMRRMAQG